MNEPGKSRDIAARAAGLGSGKTLEAARRVIEHGLSRRHQHVGTGPVLVALEGEDSIEPATASPRPRSTIGRTRHPPQTVPAENV